MDNTQIINNWIAKNRPNFDRWLVEATRLFWEDPSVRLPRTEMERRNGMETWLEQRRIKLGKELQEAFPRFFPSQAQALPEMFIRSLFDELVWPKVKPEIQRYAIFGFAAAWVGRHMGDATTIGTPDFDSRQWHVPIGVRGYGDSLGQIVLNQDGEVIPELTTTRNELLEAICEPTFSTSSAAAR